MKNYLKLSLATVYLSTSLYGENLEEDFLSLIDEATAIVTKTKVNISHLPSTISILTQEDLKKRGFKNIHEALGTLPGFESYITNVGWRELTVRGVYTANTYGFDKIKLLVDGVNVSNSLYGTIFYYLDFPIELVKRIEVLRGSASSLYGSGAFSGAINIITKNSDKLAKESFFTSFESLGYKKSGGIIKTNIADTTISLDVYKQEDSKETPLHTRGDDNSQYDFPGKSNEELDDFGLGVFIEKDKLSLNTRYKSSKSGDYFGDYKYEFDKHKSDSYYKNKILTSELQYKDSNDYFNYTFKSGISEYTFDTIYHGLPKEEVAEELGRLGLPTSLATDDSKIGVFYKERSTYVGFNINKTIDNHSFVFSIENNYIKTLDNYALINMLADSEIENILTYGTYLDGTPFSFADPLFFPEGMRKIDNAFTGERRKRTINSIYFNDLIVIDDKTDLSLGYRVDSYSDGIEFDEEDSYNMGIIHRYNKKLQIKASHGKSYRVPSFVELHFNSGPDSSLNNSEKGNPYLKSEYIYTTEFSVIYQPKNTHKIKTTLFHSKLKDTIDAAIDRDELSSEPTYSDIYIHTNYKDRTIQGIEFEYSLKTSKKDELLFNFTKLDTLAKGWQPFVEPSQKDIEYVDIAHEYGNINYKYIYNRYLTFNSFVNYTGKRYQNTKQEKLDPSTIVSENISYRVDDSSRFNFGIFNLFNSKHVVPSRHNYHKEGLPREGRFFSFSFLKEF